MDCCTIEFLADWKTVCEIQKVSGVFRSIFFQSIFTRCKQTTVVAGWNLVIASSIMWLTRGSRGWWSRVKFVLVCLRFAWASYLITFILNSPGAGFRRLIDSDFGVDKDLGSDPFRKAIVWKAIHLQRVKRTGIRNFCISWIGYGSQSKCQEKTFLYYSGSVMHPTTLMTQRPAVWTWPGERPTVM